MGGNCCKSGRGAEDDDSSDGEANDVNPAAASPESAGKGSNQELGTSAESRVYLSSKYRRDGNARDFYKIGRTLGTGAFAVVKLCTERGTNQQYACKIMNLPQHGEEVDESENSREDVFKEIEILCALGHKNVMCLKEFFLDTTKVFLITELLTGGEVLDAVLERGTYSEADAKLCFIQLLEGISYLHSQGIIHRDLKLENLLLTTKDDITNIKIVDFGLAKLASAPGKCMDTVCGTPQYVAPEVIQSAEGAAYDERVDLWSAGVILFILLGGYPPFHDESEAVMFKLIRKGKFSFNQSVWKNISACAKDLICGLLKANPAQRATAKEALNHEWITGDVSSQPLEATRENLKKTYQKKFRKAVNVIVTINKMKRLAVPSTSQPPQQEEGAEGSQNQ
ncbi:hypothetical protein BSKO_07040 [Bryopsis sp. KO-2023]|nr:hypothetical protein BSKO_07040 [Bryopsis sp. KO-2023]